MVSTHSKCSLNITYYLFNCSLGSQKIHMKNSELTVYHCHHCWLTHPLNGCVRSSRCCVRPVRKASATSLKPSSGDLHQRPWAPWGQHLCSHVDSCIAVGLAWCLPDKRCQQDIGCFWMDKWARDEWVIQGWLRWTPWPQGTHILAGVRIRPPKGEWKQGR